MKKQQKQQQQQQSIPQPVSLPDQFIELTDQELEQVTGGLNPQPIPPGRYNRFFHPDPSGVPWFKNVNVIE